MSNPIESELKPLSGQRQKSESDKSVQACNDWLRMGSGRTVAGLLEKYEFLPENTTPTKSIDTLYKWHQKFDWPSRAAEFDAGWEARKNAEREAVIGYGLALDFERLRELYRLAAFLKAQIYELSEPDSAGHQVYHNVWVPDVKSIGGGEFAERVDIERFNAPLIEQYRKVMEDIAKETGGRIQKQDITSGGESIKWPTMIEVIKPDDPSET